MIFVSQDKHNINAVSKKIKFMYIYIPNSGLDLLILPLIFVTGDS
jgi:hypothetical protein